jgi:small subunit ribosomal protein S6
LEGHKVDIAERRNLLLRYYEMIFILHPNIPEEDLSMITDKVTAVIDRHKGEVIKLDNWGKKRCAHTIKKCTKGYFFLLYFMASPTTLQELDKTLRFDEKVLRYQTVIAEKDKIEALKKEQENKEKEVAEPVPAAEPASAEE